jgi:hypothetical protein
MPTHANHMNKPPLPDPAAARHPAPAANHGQVTLARQAAGGDADARRAINELVDPIIAYQTRRFCRRFCHGNRYRYRCTLEAAPPLRTPADALLCEFGNASYAWMLDDLTHSGRLMRFEGRQGARLYDYLFRIANSLPFYERWKDWRFGRSAYVPTYIRDLNPAAGRVFLQLRAGGSIPAIAQKLHLDEAQAETLGQAIITLLTQKNRLFLLDPPRTVSLSEPQLGDHWNDETAGAERELPFFDESPEEREAKQRLQKAWGQLTTVEQFVLEAMVIDGEEAGDVLQALRKLDIPIKKGVAAKDSDRQQLYYFRRKAFDKLRRLMMAREA